jgi:hypothetical protein
MGHQLCVARFALEMFALNGADPINSDEPHRHAALGTAGMGWNAIRRLHKFGGFILD